MAEILQKSADDYTSRGHLDPAGFKQHITFNRYQPPADLAPFVSHFWVMSWNRGTELPYVSEQVMHKPYVDVYISKDDSGIQCTFLNRKDYKAEDENRIIGARFLPGAFHSFWHWSMSGLRDKTIPLQQIFPEATEEFVKNTLSLPDQGAVPMLIELLRTKNPQPDVNIAVVNDIIATIETENLQTVAQVAKRFAKSERWLQQLFQDYVGTGIKWLLQRNKLLEAAQSIRETEDPDWVAMAYDLEYSSQQHFITDFKRVLGKTPLQYKKELNKQKYSA